MGKTNQKQLRGVSYNKYQAFARLVRLGRTTWEELERAKLVKPRPKSAAILEFEQLHARRSRKAGTSRKAVESRT